MSAERPEAWLRGPIDGVVPPLQPVVFGLIYCRESIREAITGLSTEQLVARPGGIASIAFHVRHAIGSMDRLFTYAMGRQLSETQRVYLATEKTDQPNADSRDLADSFDRAVDAAIARLGTIEESTLHQAREVGRARLPSTVLGLLVHADEHTQRHTGQIVTTAKLVRAHFSHGA